MLIGILDTLIGLAAFGWLVWVMLTRLDRNGKICAGATTNVVEETYPYAYAQGQLLVTVIVIMCIVPPALFVATNCGCL